MAGAAPWPVPEPAPPVPEVEVAPPDPVAVPPLPSGTLPAPHPAATNADRPMEATPTRLNLVLLMEALVCCFVFGADAAPAGRVDFPCRESSPVGDRQLTKDQCFFPGETVWPERHC